MPATEKSLSDAHRQIAGTLGHLAFMLARKRLSPMILAGIIEELRNAANTLEEILKK